MSNFMFAVLCKRCGTQELSEKNYFEQLENPDAHWYCPKCQDSATWDDDSLCMMEDDV